jgi:hypothetical protein
VLIVPSDFPELDVATVPPEEVSSSDNLASDVVSISFTGAGVDDFQVELCLNPTSSEDLCLGYYDEFTQDWLCEDPCLQQNDDGQLCGKTDHFTNFALLLQTSSDGNNRCGSSEGMYITGDKYYDLLLILSCAGLMCCCCWFIIGFSYTPHGRKLLFGKEHQRVSVLRMNAKDYRYHSAQLE